MIAMPCRTMPDRAALPRGERFDLCHDRDQSGSGAENRRAARNRGGSRAGASLALTKHRLSLWLKSPRPYLMLIGFAGVSSAFGTFRSRSGNFRAFPQMPGPTEVIHEWFSKDPTYGLSIFIRRNITCTSGSARRRIAIAFFLATAIGVPLGLFLGWSERFKQFVFPVFELLRPVPPLAWVPLAIVMFKGSETPVIFLTFLASFYATALNTMLGVESIDVSYVRAANCLGANPLAGVPARDRARRDAVHLHWPADFGWCRLVLSGRRRDGLGTIRPRLCDQHLLHDGALSDDRYRHGRPWAWSATSPAPPCAWSATI